MGCCCFRGCDIGEFNLHFSSIGREFLIESEKSKNPEKAEVDKITKLIKGNDVATFKLI